MYRVKAYDTEGLESGYKTSNQVTVINNTAPSAPTSITVPLTVIGGEKLTITWAASSDSEGNLVGYILERRVASGSWTQVFKGNALTFQDTITKGWTTVQYRVKAYDTYNAESAYTTSETRTVDNNTAPVITCDQASGTDLGTKSSGFSVSYSVDDEDGDAVTVTESMDGTTKRTFEATLEATNQFQVTGTYFQQLLNGQHTMKMKAQDTGGKSSEYTLLFTKSVTACSITLETPMEADAQITIAALSVSGDIPADANYQVLLTNNAKDAEPVWEDATTEVKNRSNYLFENDTATNGFAFNFKVTASRGASGIGGYISSIQGRFSVMAVDWRQDSVKAIREKKATAARAEALNTQTQVAVMAFCATATTITDAQALQMPDLFPTWEQVLAAGEAIPKDRIISKGGQLYRIVQQVTPLESQPRMGRDAGNLSAH